MLRADVRERNEEVELMSSAENDPICPEPRARGVDPGGSPQRPVRVGVYGASGTSGTELISLLQAHPYTEIAFATSRKEAGKPLSDIDPAAAPVPLVAPDEVDPASADVVFLCLPHGASGEAARRCVAAGVPTIIDVSGDHRLRSAELHARIYGSERDEALAEEAVYGMTEFARAQLPGARLVANPGCYATAVAMALAPLAEAELLTDVAVVDAKSGVSGAGRNPSPTVHFCSVTEDVRPYKPGRAHRHVSEVEQFLSSCDPAHAGHPIVFTPHLVPLDRGIQATAVVRGPGLSAEAVHEIFVRRYAGEPFVQVLPLGQEARIRAVARTNRVALGVSPIEGIDGVVLTSAIDNLLKGAAGQAVQNMNAVLRHDERLGLPGPRP